MEKPRLHWIPERKFLAGGLAGAAAWLVSMLASRYLGIEISAEAIGPIIVAAGSSAYYLVPPSAQDVLRRIDGTMKATFAVPDVRGTTARLAIAFLLLGGLALGGPTACASYQVAKAESASPAATVYAITADYNATMSVAVAYAESDLADPEVVQVLARLDRVAFGTISQAQAAVRAGDGAAAALAVAAARAAVAELVAYAAANAWAPTS